MAADGRTSEIGVPRAAREAIMTLRLRVGSASVLIVLLSCHSLSATQPRQCRPRPVLFSGPVEVSADLAPAVFDSVTEVGDATVATLPTEGYPSKLAVIATGDRAWTAHVVDDPDLDDKRPVGGALVPATTTAIVVLDSDSSDGGDWELVVLRGDTASASWEVCGCVPKVHYSGFLVALVMSSASDGQMVIRHDHGDYYPGGDYVSTTRDGGCNWSPPRTGR